MSGELTQTDWRTEIHVLCAFVSILSAVGTFGNVLILMVYMKRCDKRASNVFIKVLAVLDLLVCLVVMPYSIILWYKLVTSEFVCKCFELLRRVNVIMSNFTLVAVAVQRYLAICRPTMVVSFGYVNKGMALMLVISTLFSFPSMWIYSVVPSTRLEQLPIFNFTNASTEYVKSNGPSYCQFTSTLVGPTLALMYQGATAVLSFTFAIVIILLYVFIYRTVWKRDKVWNKARISPNVWMTGENGAVDATAQDNETEPLQTFQPKRPSTDNVSNPQADKTQVGNDEISDLSACLKRSRNTSQTVAPTSNVPRPERNFHRKTGTMLFICTIVYILTWTPFWLDIFGVTHSLVFRHMIFISNASNPIVYGIVSKQVRKAMTKILCRKKNSLGNL